MRAFVLSTVAAVSLAAIAGPAQGAVLSIGGPLSYNCYQAALSRNVSAATIDGCSRSLSEEGLSARDRAATHVNRGILRMMAGAAGPADADFDAAIALKDNLSDAWLNKGFLRLRQGNGRDALPLLQKGIDRGPNSPALALFARGVAHEQMGDYRAAYADLKRAHELAPRWSMPTEYLASYRVSSR